MKILIVDDNKNNRMIIKLLLEDFEEDNDISFELDEAEDGLVALNKCKNSFYDVIFMDIMMPNMDGIEATREIKKLNSTVMIIAVSAVDDGERKKLILSNGAEDYIAKPINSDIFVNRIKNYMLLVDARNHKKENKRNINLFTKEIFSRHTNFIIEGEDSLSQFWEYYLLTDTQKSDSLSDIVRTIFAIADTQLRLSIKSYIYVEESETQKFFTLTNIGKLPSKTVDLIVKKNSLQEEYRVSDGKISIVLNCHSMTELKPEILSEVTQLKTSITKEPISSFEVSGKLEVYDYLDADDLYDLEEYAGKLSSILLVVSSGDITNEEISEIYIYLDRLASVLSSYSEVYAISQALKSLSEDMSTYMNEFSKNSEALGPMCKAFSNDLLSWIEQSFHTGAPSVDFMNDTIAVNCQTISGMLKMDEVVDDDFDDIFDF